MDNIEHVYDPQKIEEKVFGFIYGCGMHDAILQKSFTGERKWVGEVKAPIALLREYADRVLHNRFDSKDAHDRYFLELANRICEAINKAHPNDKEIGYFHFGNAQKLINMTVKHLYTFCYHTSALREGFRYCHCPLDSIMLGKVWGEYEEYFGKQEKRKARLGEPKQFLKAWGCEGADSNTAPQPWLESFPDRYALFQTVVYEMAEKGNLYPIEYDYLVWNEEEEKKNKKA